MYMRFPPLASAAAGVAATVAETRCAAASGLYIS